MAKQVRQAPVFAASSAGLYELLCESHSPQGCRTNLWHLISSCACLSCCHVRVVHRLEGAAGSVVVLGSMQRCKHIPHNSTSSSHPPTISSSCLQHTRRPCCSHLRCSSRSSCSSHRSCHQQQLQRTTGTLAQCSRCSTALQAPCWTHRLWHCCLAAWAFQGRRSVLLTPQRPWLQECPLRSSRPTRWGRPAQPSQCLVLACCLLWGP